MQVQEKIILNNINENPIKNLYFQERIIKTREIKEYHLIKNIC